MKSSPILCAPNFYEPGALMGSGGKRNGALEEAKALICQLHTVLISRFPLESSCSGFIELGSIPPPPAEVRGRKLLS